MLSRTSDNTKDRPGYAHRLENNIGLLSRINIDETKCTLKNNRLELNKTDFKSLDKNQFTKARQADGTLPKITLMKLK